ncbi:MAG: peptidoglycan DD-metalloendopeptidase family protein [Deltaproteobacteria bacterium]|nr:peptidoglycan DD-metalloendopeptidase family protein [Deltaproteobacteria bacterium]
MERLRNILKKAITPITIMVVPHARTKPRRIDVPFFMIILVFTFFVVGVLYTFSTAVKSVEYRRMKRMVQYYKNEFQSLSSTIKSIKNTETELAKLLSLKSKRKILEEFEENSNDSVDIEALKKEIEKTIETVSEIRNYLREEKDKYLSTPMGWPVLGSISSRFGNREHPLTKDNAFHSGIDINVPEGTPIKATACGIVVYSGWSYGNGNVVVIEHGHSFTTLYAHNKKNLVTVGQKVKRGETIALSGSTGDTTGPHVHYEVWKNGKPVNPEKFLEGGHDVSKK